MRRTRTRFGAVVGTFIVTSAVAAAGLLSAGGLGAGEASATTPQRWVPYHRTATAKADQRTTGPLCGTRRTSRSHGRTWTCTFDDEFSGSSLDRTKWIVPTTKQSGFTTADSCYVDDPANVNVAAGALHLVAITGPLKLCRGLTRHTAGAVNSHGLFAQALGRFEARIRYPETTASGLWSNFWIYPYKLAYGRWPASGEVDVAERWSSHGDSVFPSLHYPLSTRADTGQTCAVKNAAAWHTYRLDWTRTSMSFYYDGQLCFRRDWTAVTRSTRPFDQPFDVVLSNGFGDPTTRRISSLLPKAGSMDVDYVRVWR